MITIKGKKKHHAFHDSWEELTRAEFISVCRLLKRYYMGEFDTFYEFRVHLLESLTGYERSKKKMDDQEKETIDDNIYMLANMLRFPTKPYYPEPEALNVLSPELQAKLNGFFPFEIYEPQFQSQLETVKDVLKYKVAPNFNLKSNPLPFFKFKEVMFFGPEFHIDENGVFETDIIAGEYTAALEYYGLYKKTKSTKYLRYLTAILYRTNRKEFNRNDCKANAKLFKKLDEGILDAVEFFFQNLQELIYTMPDIKILFNRNKTSKGISLGVDETLYNLSQEGYGSKAEIDRLPLEDYLKMMLKSLLDYVGQLRSMDVKDAEIAKKTGLSISIIQNIQ